MDIDLTPPPRRGEIQKAPPKGRYTGRPPTYYNEAFGKGLLPILISMIETRQDKEILRGNVSSDTIYQRTQQAFCYCVDHLDHKGVLEELRKEVMIRRTLKGVVICFKENADKYARQAHAHAVVAKVDAFKVRDAVSVNWREHLHNFIEGDADSLLLNDGFAISPAEANEIRGLVQLMPEGCPQIEIVKLDMYVIHLRRVKQ